MPTLRAALCIVTAQLLLSSCSVPIKDEQFCSPVPGNLGAVCDNFLTSNQLILDDPGWQALQASWRAKGQSTECTTSQTLGDIKDELEKLCSKTPCSYPVQKQLDIFLKGLDKIQALGQGGN